MTGKTHIATGMLAGEILFHLQQCKDFRTLAVIITVTTLGAILPDLDYPYSTITKSTIPTRVVSKGITKITEHRGVLHTPLFSVLAALFLKTILIICHIQQSATISIALFLGIMTHLILDTLTPTGIMWLFPIKRKHFSLMRINTGSIIETFFRVVISITLIISSYRIFSELVPSAIQNLCL